MKDREAIEVNVDGNARARITVGTLDTHRASQTFGSSQNSLILVHRVYAMDPHATNT
jgi:hypothetical protein